MATRPQPAWQTKDVRRLEYRLWPSDQAVTLVQDDGQGDSTGRTLWLSAQVLSVCLIRRLGQRGGRAIELGAGTGLVSLTLASLGIDVVATDVPLILESTTVPSMACAQDRPGWGRITPLALDWLSGSVPEADFDLVVTADTVYSPELNVALLATISALSSPPRPIRIIVALERRDPLVVDAFFKLAEEQFACKRWPEAQVRQDLDGMGWTDDDWDGVELWDLSPRR